MGLDMYLTASRLIWQHDKRDQKIAMNIATQFPDIPGRLKEVEYEVAYWRKANAIHNWFVKNVQDGKDECEKFDVSIEQLQSLVSACKSVLARHSLAEKLLPPTSGFFFGNTDIDDWYFEDLQKTINMLMPVIEADMTGWDIQYRSSW